MGAGKGRELISRTIADLAGFTLSNAEGLRAGVAEAPTIGLAHVAEALQYRPRGFQG